MWKPIYMLLDRLRTASQTGEVMNMKYFYAAVTLDIINSYCFAREPVVVNVPDFGRESVDNIDSFLRVSLLNIHFPWVLRFTTSLPVSPMLFTRTESSASWCHFYRRLSYSDPCFDIGPSQPNSFTKDSQPFERSSCEYILNLPGPVT